jgi:hypothetical protein
MGFPAASSFTTCFFWHPVAMKAMAITAINNTNQTDDFLSIPLSSFLKNLVHPLLEPFEKRITE